MADTNNNHMSDTKIIDFVKKRSENVEQKRRAFERLVFQNFLGAYSVLDNNGTISPIELVDISQDGCLFQVPWKMGKDSKIPKGTEILLRMYFTKGSYIPCLVNIKHGKEVVMSDGVSYMQYGCEFNKSYSSFEAMETFIDFMYKFAKHSALDKGDTKIYFK